MCRPSIRTMLTLLNLGCAQTRECIYTDAHAYMHVACVNMPGSQHLHTQVSVLIRVMMMLPAKTPTHHIISCCSKLSCLITAIKLCVLFVHKFWCVNAGMCVWRLSALIFSDVILQKGLFLGCR